MMNQVMQRPMFAMPVRRETGTPEGGETTSTTPVSYTHLTLPTIYSV